MLDKFVGFFSKPKTLSKLDARKTRPTSFLHRTSEDSAAHAQDSNTTKAKASGDIELKPRDQKSTQRNSKAKPPPRPKSISFSRKSSGTQQGAVIPATNTCESPNSVPLSLSPDEEDKGRLAQLMQDPRWVAHAFEQILLGHQSTEHSSEAMRNLTEHVKLELIRMNTLKTWKDRRANGENVYQDESTIPVCGTPPPTPPPSEVGVKAYVRSDRSLEDSSVSSGLRKRSRSVESQHNTGSVEPLSRDTSEHKKQKTDKSQDALDTCEDDSDLRRPMPSHDRAQDSRWHPTRNSVSSEAPFGPDSKLTGLTAKQCVQALDSIVPSVTETVTPEHERRNITIATNISLFMRLEQVTYPTTFIENGGMKSLVNLTKLVLNLEWRELYHTSLLWQLLRVIKSLLILPAAATVFHSGGYHDILFPQLVKMQFSWGEDRRAFFQFQRRQIIIELLLEYMVNVRDNAGLPKTDLQSRANAVLNYLRDDPEKEKPMHDFIAVMYKQRRYKNWYKELKSTVAPWTGTPWMYWHKNNIIAVSTSTDTESAKTYRERHWPERRWELACSSVRSHVETYVSLYLAANIDLLNAIVATVPDKLERLKLRQELADTGIEDLFGRTLRQASQTNFPCIASSLATYCRAAQEDEWPVKHITHGPYYL